MNATRARLKDWSETGRYRIGAVKAEVEGGLDQISVEGWVLMVNSAGRWPFPGTGSLVLTKWNCGEDIVGVLGLA